MVIMVQLQKKYAEDNSIKFDYISNWNKQTSGTDVTAPTVTAIEVPYSSVSKYSNNDQYVVPANAKLTINVKFNEEIKGTIPTLIIKFGDGQNIEIKDGAISGSSIKYVYTIKSSDLGIMSTVDLTGGDITDLAGNKAVLSCPKVVVPYFSRVIYANGTITNPETPDSNNNQSPNDGQNSDDGDNKKTEGKKRSRRKSRSNNCKRKFTIYRSRNRTNNKYISFSRNRNICIFQI